VLWETKIGLRVLSQYYMMMMEWKGRIL